MTARRLFLFAFAAALLAGLGCSNDPATTGPALVCTDGGDAAPNGVNTNCGMALDAVTERVDIVMGGPNAGSTTLRGLNFDVVYDPAKLTFMPAASYTSTLFPGAPDRGVVGSGGPRRGFDPAAGQTLGMSQ